MVLIQTTNDSDARQRAIEFNEKFDRDEDFRRATLDGWALLLLDIAKSTMDDKIIMQPMMTQLKRQIISDSLDPVEQWFMDRTDWTIGERRKSSSL